MDSDDPLLRTELKPEIRVLSIRLGDRNHGNGPPPAAGIAMGLASADGLHLVLRIGTSSAAGQPNRSPIVSSGSEMWQTVAD